MSSKACVSGVEEERAGGGPQVDSVRPAPTSAGDRRSRALVAPGFAMVMAISFGLCAGYLDVLLIVLRRSCLNPEGYYRIARDFPWSVPAAHAALLMIPGAVLAVLSRLRPGLVSLRAGAWMLAMLAIWGALLRLPLYGWGSLLLAGGLGRVVGDAIAARYPGRALRRAPMALLGVLGVLAALSSGWRALREYRDVGALPNPPPRARNVVLIVWDTVRADRMSQDLNNRDTTPNLARWARTGVTYHTAVAPAPWTFPSHSCFLTGRWPMKLDSQWKPRLETPDPTLAEYLATRGYQTAGFVANTNCCTYESGLDRGFIHYDDYATTPKAIFARTVPGQWLIEHALDLVGDHHGRKWAALQSRPAGALHDAFLDWLGRRRADRPFFAFLNDFDAHDTYIPPPGFEGRFGIRPASRRDFRLLEDFVGLEKAKVPARDVLMARDCYDDCIAYLDDQLGRLLDELGRRGVLADTDIIITSDHGEAFGEHGLFGHGYTVLREETRVPLVILSPGAPAGGQVYHPVSLRDLPATVVDRLGLAAGSPFPGRSLASYWGLPPGRLPAEPTTPAFTEQAGPTARLLLRPEAGPGGLLPGFQMSLVAWNHHYIRDGEGGEWLYDLSKDPLERSDRRASDDHGPLLQAFRAMLLDILEESPGSPRVERTYLQEYRQALEALVRGKAGGTAATASRTDPFATYRQPGT